MAETSGVFTYGLLNSLVNNDEISLKLTIVQFNNLYGKNPFQFVENEQCLALELLVENDEFMDGEILQILHGRNASWKDDIKLEDFGGQLLRCAIEKDRSLKVIQEILETIPKKCITQVDINGQNAMQIAKKRNNSSVESYLLKLTITN